MMRIKIYNKNKRVTAVLGRLNGFVVCKERAEPVGSPFQYMFLLSWAFGNDWKEKITNTSSENMFPPQSWGAQTRERQLLHMESSKLVCLCICQDDSQTLLWTGVSDISTQEENPGSTSNTWERLALSWTGNALKFPLSWWYWGDECLDPSWTQINSWKMKATKEGEC